MCRAITRSLLLFPPAFSYTPHLLMRWMVEAQGGKAICPESQGRDKKGDEPIRGARRDPGLCFVLFVHSANVYCANEKEN